MNLLNFLRTCDKDEYVVVYPKCGSAMIKGYVRDILPTKLGDIIDSCYDEYDVVNHVYKNRENGRCLIITVSW